MKVILIFSDLRLTRFMQDADLFEKFKVVLKPAVKATVVNGWGAKHIAALKRNCEGDGDVGLVAAVSKKKVHFRDESVKSVSDGKNWIPLDEMLTTLQGGL